MGQRPAGQPGSLYGCGAGWILCLSSGVAAQVLPASSPSLLQDRHGAPGSSGAQESIEHLPCSEQKQHVCYTRTAVRKCLLLEVGKFKFFYMYIYFSYIC